MDREFSAPSRPGLPMPPLVLALDQGTTSSRAIVFRPRRSARRGSAAGVPAALPQSRPCRARPRGDLGLATRHGASEALATSRSVRPSDIAAIGVTNQRETTILWDRATGKPVANAIVWQSRITRRHLRTARKPDGTSRLFREKTGLVVDAYFSGTKIKHLLDTIPGLRGRAERGEILFGTVDTFLIWRLTGGKRARHRLSATPAARCCSTFTRSTGTTNC